MSQKEQIKAQITNIITKKYNFIHYNGITPQRFLTQSSDEAVEAANKLGFPVVLKVDSSEILHKTEAGVVRVNVKDDVEVSSVFNEIMESAKKVSNAKDINGVLVEEMVTGGIEVMAGLTI